MRTDRGIGIRENQMGRPHLYRFGVPGGEGAGMAAHKTAEVGLWERWPVRSRRATLRPLGGISSTLGQLLQDTGEAPNFGDHCSHENGLIRTAVGVTCIWCDQYPAFYNPQFFEREEETEL